MALRIEPQYGYGWRSAEGDLLETPPVFHVEGALDSASILGGLVVETGHPLSGLWVELSIRVNGPLPTYNVRLFQQKPEGEAQQQPYITGFAGLAQG